MASEISWRHSETDKTVYTTIRASDHTYWNTSGSPALEALTVANWTDYDVVLTETPASGYFYVGTWPTGLVTNGWYWLDFFEQAATGAPAISDPLIGGMVAYWDGTNISSYDSNLREWLGTVPPAYDPGFNVNI